MDRPITPLRAASFGILLLALWLIVWGIWKTIELPFVFGAIPKMGLSVTYVTIVLIILWKMLPLGIGIFLFRQHWTVIHWFCGTAVSKDSEQDSWSNTSLPAILLTGLFGLFLAARGLQRFCDEWTILMQILAIDNPAMWQHGNWSLWFASTYPSPILWTCCPILFGLVFIIGARRIGNLVGRQIDKSLEHPSDEEEKEGNLS